MAYINRNGQRTNATVTPVDVPTPEPAPLPDDDTQPLPDVVLKTLVEKAVKERLDEILKPVRVDFLGNTFEVPELLREPIGLAFVAFGKELQVQGYRYAGITTLTEVDAQIYGRPDSRVTTSSTPDMSGYMGSMLNEILNGDGDDSEGKDNDYPIAS